MSTSKLRALARLGWRDLSTHRWRSAFSALAIFAVTAPTTSALLLGRGQLSQSTGPGESLLPTFALIVGVLGLGLVVTLLAAVFLASFHARLRELGHLSAGGGVATDIAGAVIVPALFLGLIGGVPGGVVGLLAGRAAGVAVGAPLPTTAEGALLAAAVSAGIVGACLACAAYPAIRAIRTDPIAALRGESGRIARPWTAWLALLGVPAIGVGVFLARRGAIQIDVGAVLVGVLLVGVGASALTALALRLLGTVRVPGSFSATFALRDAGRHQIRVVPGVAAGLGLIAAVVAGMVYIESSRSAAQRMHLLDAPLGGAFVMTADLAEATAAAEAIAPVVQAVPATVAHVPGSFTARADGGPFAGDHESFSTGSSALLGGVGVLVVTPELADVFGFPAETRSALAAGKLATRAGDFGMASGEGTLYFIDPQEEPFALPVAVVLPDAAPAVLAVSEERARELGWPVTVTGIVVMTDRPLTREDQGALTPPGANVELGLHIDTAPAQYALLGAGTALVALLVWALAGLARAEALRDAAIVEAVGAPPGFTRRVAGLQALLQAGLAALAGVPTGIALGRVFLAIREAAVPGQPDAVAIPWPQIAALAVLLPLGVAIVTAITTPVSRRRGVPRPIA